MRRLWAIVCVGFLLFSGAAYAEGKRVALVIGVSSYQNAPALPNPLNDAVDMAAMLQSVGFEVVEAYDPDYAGLQKALRDFGRKLQGADTGLLFYAGHGVQVDGKNYLLPKDVKLADDGAVQREAVDVSGALSLLMAERRVSLVFLDACRDNPLAASLARRAGVARSLAVSQGLAQLPATGADMLVAYSTQPGAVAADGGGRNSPFTSALLKHTPTPGLDVQEMMRRVRRSVMASTGGVQVPWDNSSLTQSFAFAPAAPGRSPPSEAAWVPPARDPSPRQLDVAMWNDVKGGSTAEIQAYLNRFPNGVFAEIARARIAGLQQAATADRDRARTMARDIAAEFAKISGRGAIIDNPQQPLDFYANARLYELRGDFLNARRSYVSYLRAGLPYVDPHYRFQSFLKVQEGRAGAREVYGELTSGKTDLVSRYATALLQNDDQRKAALEELARTNADFAPALYELSRDYSAERLGTQTSADKARQQELLTKFVALADNGKYLGWFIDQSVASSQLEDARRTLVVLQRTAVAKLVTLNSMRSNSGWTLNIQVAESAPVQEYFVQFPGRALSSTGFMDAADFRTGKPAPRPFFDLPRTQGPVTIQVSYRDASGAMRGPFPMAFNPDTALLAGDKQTLEITKNAWLSFRNYDGRKMLYFTHILGSRCAVKEIRYGLDTMTPNRSFPVGACDKLRPGEIDTDTSIHIDTPLPTRFASAQITYYDGTKSTIERFDAE